MIRVKHNGVAGYAAISLYVKVKCSISRLWWSTPATSHTNSRQRLENQPFVVESIVAHIEAREICIMGVLVESHLVARRQNPNPKDNEFYKSIQKEVMTWKDVPAPVNP